MIPDNMLKQYREKIANIGAPAAPMSLGNIGRRATLIARRPGTAALAGGVLGAGLGAMTADDDNTMGHTLSGAMMGAGLGAGGSMAAKHFGAFAPKPAAPPVA